VRARPVAAPATSAEEGPAAGVEAATGAAVSGEATGQAPAELALSQELGPGRAHPNGRAATARETTAEMRPVAGPPVRHGGRLTILDRLMRSGPARWFFGNSFVDRCIAPARGMGSLAKFLRYSMVSAVAIVISQVVILIAAWLFHLSGIASNALGAAASTPASFELNRKWAWGKTGKSHMWKEVLPFWALTLTGLAASTGTVEIADSMAKSHHVLGLDRALLIMGASLFAWGVVWVAKFVIFNRLVFAPRPADSSGPSHGLSHSA
jgi:putative flippase GtrA